MADHWDRYYARFDRIEAEFKEPLGAIAGACGAELVVDRAAEDYQLVFEVTKPGDMLSVSLSLQDASGQGEGEPGDAGNIMCEVIGDGGVVVGTFGPGNYTDGCWAGYGDESAWAQKTSDMRAALESLPALIEEWRAK